jgi:hypothetical protein
MPGKYQSLCQYVENRYANTVVLTFAQIEDLLGFTLPDWARVDQEWWANKDPNDTPAMEAGVSNHVWAVEEIGALLDQRRTASWRSASREAAWPSLTAVAMRVCALIAASIC